VPWSVCLAPLTPDGELRPSKPYLCDLVDKRCNFGEWPVLAQSRSLETSRSGMCQEQTCRHMIVSKWLRFSTLGKNGQIKRILAKARDADVDDLVMLAQVSSNDISSFIAKIKRSAASLR
jgi:hypothetical protein